ncbi:uncharacterized protein LOC143083072 [Mytilus galloprovincialis]|uniref:uncharacterized protein n=1 Tax=Mytilus edulis TaxID=6550 RepID=UPI0039F06265
MATTSSRAEEILNDEALAEEELLDELENAEIPAYIREARLDMLKKHAVNLNEMKEKQHGQYTEITEEKKFLDLTTTEKKCIVHFYHSDFRRCAIMDTHLEALATKHFETKFAKINVDICKFFVEKLKIRTLPAVFCFINGQVVDKITGFEELGNTDDFQTSTLEGLLGISGVIQCTQEDKTKKTIFGFKKSSKNDDSDTCESDENDWN